MKTKVIGILVGLISCSTFASPDGQRHTDHAKVTNVVPIYKTIEHRVPSESCWVETVREERHVKPRRSATGTIVGGIIGGVVGNSVGRGSDNKKIGAVVGTVLGMSVANDIQRHSRRDRGHDEVSYHDVERCEVSHTIEREEILTGYKVHYRYQGNHYQTFMDRHPGDKIRVAVQVKPM
jgi:uncharacterized protein YcfJ